MYPHEKYGLVVFCCSEHTEQRAEWFGPAERLLLAGEPVFNDEFTEFGKWMDGWESRRKRVAGHDWCIIK